MAAWPRAQVAGAAANQKSVDLARAYSGFVAGFLEGIGPEARCVEFIKRMEAAGVALENRWQVWFAEVPSFDPRFAKKNSF